MSISTSYGENWGDKYPQPSYEPEVIPSPETAEERARREARDRVAGAAALEGTPEEA